MELQSIKGDLSNLKKNRERRLRWKHQKSSCRLYRPRRVSTALRNLTQELSFEPQEIPYNNKVSFLREK